MKAVLAILVIIFSFSAKADNLYTGAWSYHINSTPFITNETHHLLAYEHDRLIVGAFKNSYGDLTAVVGSRFELFEAGDFRGGIYLGITYGYRTCDNMAKGNPDRVFCPAVVPEISYTRYKLQPTVMLLGNAIALSFKWKL